VKTLRILLVRVLLVGLGVLILGYGVALAVIGSSGPAVESETWEEVPSLIKILR
jgi:hypothetical protein